MKKTVILSLLIATVGLSAFARTNFTTSIGAYGQYGNIRNVNYGIHYDLKKNIFDFNFDVGSNEKVDRIMIDTFFGANIFVNNYLGGRDYHAFVMSFLPGVAVSFAVPYVNTFVSILPLIRYSLAWTTPGGFDFKVLIDAGYEFELLQTKGQHLYYKLGLALGYSFDLEEEDYAHKAAKWRD